MRILASFAMRGRSQAAMVATVLALFSLLMPVLSILSSAVVALVTLRQGARNGLVVGGISVLAGSLLALILPGHPVLQVVSFLVILWLPVWALALLLRASRSPNLTLQVALGFGVLVIGVVYLQAPDPARMWAQMLAPLGEGFAQSGALTESDAQQFVQELAAWMTGVMAAGFAMQLMLGLLLARWWQSLLFNPGGFGQEFQGLHVHPVLAYVALPLFALILLQGHAAVALPRDLGILLAPLFFLQGLAVAHNLAFQHRVKKVWLVVLYLLLFFVVPHAELAVTATGLADVWIDFRVRFRKKTKTGQG